MSEVGLNLSGDDAGQVGKSSKGSCLVKSIVAIVVLAVIVAGAWFAFNKFVSSGPDYPGPGTGTVLVEVPQGAAIPAIGNVLVEKDVVASVDTFTKAASRDSRARNIQAGYYEMQNQMSVQGALDILTDPANVVTNAVVVTEGMQANQVFEEASKITNIPVADFEEAASDPAALGVPKWGGKNIEGFLFPASYQFAPGSNATQILKPMVTRFNEVAAEIDFAQRAEEQGKKPYDLLIISSIIEAEGLPQYFGKVSRVIENRIEVGMPLQMDSTINYYQKTSEIDLTAEQLQRDQPYNTHTRKGLPPTPIGNPGQGALEASLSPEDGPWLYFLSIPGTEEMRFTDNYDEFLEDQKDLRAALEGLNQ